MMAQMLMGSVNSTLLNGLTVYYALSDTSDSTGGGLTLTNHNTVTFGAGKIGNAANFVAASNQYLTRADAAQFQMGTGDFSFAVWVKFSTAASNNSFFQYGDATTGYGVWTNSTGIQGWIAASGTQSFCGAIHSFNDDAWHLCILTYTRASNMQMYVDNTTEGSAVDITGASGTVNNANGLSLGGMYNGTNLLTGSDDEVGLWNKVLTSTERSNLWNGGSGISYPF